MEALRKLANLCSLKARVGSAESQFLLLAVKRTHVKLIFFILPLVCFDSVSYIFVRHGDREEEWRLFCNPPVNILPERRQPGLLSAVPQGEAAAAHLGALLQPGHAYWRLHRRRHHCSHSHTTGDRWVSFLFGLPTMMNIQILPNINLRFEYFCSYNSSDIQRESFVTFKSANNNQLCCKWIGLPQPKLWILLQNWNRTQRTFQNIVHICTLQLCLNSQISLLSLLIHEWPLKQQWEVLLNKFRQDMPH